MLNALSVLLDGGSEHGSERAANSMQRQGFVAASRFDWDNGTLETWAHPGQRSVGSCDVRTSLGVACCVGPTWYRGRFGRAALGLMLDDIGVTGCLDEAALRGNFVLFLRTQQHCLLMNDVLGFVRLYVSADCRFYSTSWLATCAYAGSVEVDEAAASEYVLLGAPYSDRSVANGVTTLRLAHAVDLTCGRQQPRLRPSIWGAPRAAASFDVAADEICAHLRKVCGEIAAAFTGRVRTALSGGFDSRLILAGLLSSGIRPELFVFGSLQSEDVAIAQMVANGVGIPLDVIDKDLLNEPAPRPDLEGLVHSSLFFDGLPNDGIYDPGADKQTRLEQNVEGRIALNGGGGEIFRNFFHLPDRPLRAVDVVRTFFRGFDPSVFRRPAGLAAYEDNLVNSIGHSLGPENITARQMLAREQVELLYPLFRCHYWMSVNNSVAVRHGYYATPLVDLSTVRLAYSLPLAWKNAGRLESRLIAKLHHGIANQPSAYKFRFSDGPGWRASLGEWITCMRPVSMRPFINAARRRVHRTRVSPDMIVHCRNLLPGEWRLDPVLDLERLPDDNAFARALAVEVAWRELVG